MLVTAQDFQKSPYIIPNLDSADVLADFNSFVEEEEKVVLKKVLGPNLYTEFAAGLLIVPIEDRWVRLRDGYIYDWMGTGYEWVGLKKALVPYIYAMWIRYQVQKFDGSAVVLPAFENADRVDPSWVIVNAYNRFVDLIGSKSRLRTVHADNLVSYLTVYTDSYVGLRFGDLRKMNTFNI